MAECCALYHVSCCRLNQSMSAFVAREYGRGQLVHGQKGAVHGGAFSAVVFSGLARLFHGDLLAVFGQDVMLLLLYRNI